MSAARADAPYAPHRPLLVRLANRTERLPGRHVSFDVDDVIGRARRKARADGDVGPARPALEQLLQSLEGEAQLTPLGRRLARDMVVDFAAKRLRLEALRERQREIFEQPVAVAAVVVGLPRTGTTLLHRLLALGPGVRAPLLEEVWSPLPPAQGRRDRRRRERNAALGARAALYMAPQLRVIHPPRAGEPEEDREFHAAGFLSGHFSLMFHVPSYLEYVLAQPPAAGADAYDVHRGFLQCLQWGADQHLRWVLKSPVHRPFVGCLLDAYPEAVVLDTRRDPAEAVGSLCSLAAVTQGVFTDHVDLHAIGRAAVQVFRETSARLAEARARHPGRVMDVAYADLVADPVGTVLRLAEPLQLPVTADFERRLVAWVEADRATVRPRHDYSLEPFGLDASQLQAERVA